MRDVVISNVFADDNRGGAAITSGVVSTVATAFPGARIQLVSVVDAVALPGQHRHTTRAHPAVTAVPAPVTVGGGPAAGVRAVLRSLVLLARGAHGAGGTAEAIATADLVVSKGGHVFVQRGGLRGLLSLWLTAFPLTLARRHRIPTVVLATTIGPYATRPSRWLNRWLLRGVTLVLPRDARSTREALGLGLARDAVVQVPDIVFGFPPPGRDAVDRRVAALGLAGSRFGVVSMRSDNRLDAHVAPTVALCRELLDRGVVERLVVVVQVAEGDGPEVRGHRDRATSERLVSQVADPRVTLLDMDLSPDALIELYGGAVLVTGWRMHASIFGLVARTPAFPITLEAGKVEGVFESLGLDDLLLDGDHLDLGRAADRIEAVLRDAGTIGRIDRAMGLAAQDVARVPELLRGIAG